jgi:hypothetical protein
MVGQSVSCRKKTGADPPSFAANRKNNKQKVQICKPVRLPATGGGGNKTRFGDLRVKIV